MTDRETMRSLVDKAYAARASGNLEGLMATFNPDAVFELAGDQNALPLTQKINGHGNIREAMSGFIGAFEFKQRAIISFIAEGDRAAVHSRLTVRFVPKDITFNSDLVDLFRFKDGKIDELIEFIDTALIGKLTGST